MKAAIAGAYGPPESIRVEQVPDPEPGKGEVLLRVEAAAVTAGDARIRAGRFPRGFGVLARLALGFRGPRRPVLGIAVSGVVERLGSGTVVFAPGDAVAGMIGARMGGHAQLLTVAASKLTPKPSDVSHADAAGALFGGTTALHFLRDRAELRAGQHVLINGASGSVGSAAVQLARLSGATVTAVTSGGNAELVRSLGAETVIDYTREPLERLVSRLTAAPADERFDVVFDAVGNLARAAGLELLAPNGVLILAAADLLDTARARGRVFAGSAPERPQDAAELLRLVAHGEFDPLTRSLPGLESIVDAYALVDGGRKVGNVVVLPQLPAPSTLEASMFTSRREDALQADLDDGRETGSSAAIAEFRGGEQDLGSSRNGVGIGS